MYQIIFNEISAAEMAALPKELQLDLLAEFECLPENLDELDPGKFGKLERNGKTLHRYRAKEHRIYFERRPEGVTVHRVLHKNTLQDFLFRSKLSSAEDEQLSKKEGFWKLIEAGAQAGKKVVNAKLWVCVITGVLVAHLCILFIIGNIRTAGKPPPPPPEPTFTTSTTTYTSAQGEKLKVVHEFTVQTELVPAAVLEKLPPPPSPEAAQTAAPAAAN